MTEDAVGFIGLGLMRQGFTRREQGLGRIGPTLPRPRFIPYVPGD
jgi:hypothetical protein